MDRPIKRLQAFARSLGARIVVQTRVPYNTSDSAYNCPFGMQAYIDWRKKTIYVERADVNKPENIGGLIHELGHTVGMRETPVRVDEGKFLGWEWCVAKKLRLVSQWTKSMKDYQVDSDRTRVGRARMYGELTPDERKEVMSAAVRDGIKYGNLGPRGRPLAVR